MCGCIEKQETENGNGMQKQIEVTCTDGQPASSECEQSIEVVQVCVEGEPQPFHPYTCLCSIRSHASQYICLKYMHG